MLTILDLDGVDSRSAAVFAKDCNFPITRMDKHIEPDEVFANMPVFVGAWADDTTQPVVTGVEVDVTTTPQTSDACEPATVKTFIDTCDVVAPNMKRVYIGSPNIDWEAARQDFCRRRNMRPGDFRPWRADGSFDPGVPYALDFYRISIAGQAMAMAEILARSAVKGDDANLLEFDGLYTQLSAGWTASGGRACPSSINVEQSINWNTLTGGSGTASPDATTIAAQTISIWGVTHAIPAGLNLVQFLEDFWFDKIEREYAARFGGVDSYEIHVPWGTRRCIINSASCMQPCGITSQNDPEVRERQARLRAGKLTQFYPSGRIMPVLETKWIAANTMRVLPKSIGGSPTYGLFLDDVVGNRDAWEETYGAGEGMYMSNDALIESANAAKIDFDNRVFVTDIRKKSQVCFNTSILTRAGVLATARHLCLKITNVTCSNIMSAPASVLKLDTVALN